MRRRLFDLLCEVAHYHGSAFLRAEKLRRECRLENEMKTPDAKIEGRLAAGTFFRGHVNRLDPLYRSATSWPIPFAAHSLIVLSG